MITITIVKNQVILASVVACLAVFGEYSLLTSVHEYFDARLLEIGNHGLIELGLLTIFVAPLFYYFVIITRLIKYAVTDHLTGISNRAQFNVRHAALIKRKTPFQLMLLDLCKFKEINDTHGHLIGDEVLKIVASRLTESVGNKGFVARLGGDEFVVLIPGDDADGVAEAVAAAVRQPIITHGRELKISVSIGVTSYPAAGTDKKTLMTRADCAMYNAKRNGIDIFVCHPGESCCNFQDTQSNNERRANRP